MLLTISLPSNSSCSSDIGSSTIARKMQRVKTPVFRTAGPFWLGRFGFPRTGPILNVSGPVVSILYAAWSGRASSAEDGLLSLSFSSPLPGFSCRASSSSLSVPVSKPRSRSGSPIETAPFFVSPSVAALSSAASSGVLLAAAAVPSNRSRISLFSTSHMKTSSSDVNFFDSPDGRVFTTNEAMRFWLMTQTSGISSSSCVWT
mmetsp:Transcript_21973/g.55366  ORF Transcript_21973/g.55366 Transcript_21973/m.55366 type:complete len:203 (-) Transcript_21973:56-664(-)